MPETVFLQHRPICLASSSPRRRDYLNRLGLQFEVEVPAIDETQRKGEDSESFVQRMALEKALKVQSQIVKLEQDTLILAGDTIVLLEEAILGKPSSEGEARHMLRILSGRNHTVHTAFTLLDTRDDETVNGYAVTGVKFFPLSEALINWYATLGEGMDKAGGYSIQGLGTLLVSSIRGSYNNVVGFPIEQILKKMLERQWIRVEMPRKQ